MVLNPNIKSLEIRKNIIEKMTEVQRTLDKWGNIIVRTMQKKLLAGNKVASGQLINSLTYKYSYVNGMYRVQITGAQHLINVDRGRRIGAKKPPVDKIINWIKQKHITINNKSQPMVARGRKQPAEQKIRGMAYAIATNISKRGIKPFPILQLGQTISNSKQFKRELTLAAAKDAIKQLRLK